MSHCTGAPAEQLAEQYVAGTLPDSESRAFEEHYFDCPVCLAQLQALEAVALQIHRNPVKIPGRVIAWPAIVGAIGAIAALLLIAVIGYRDFARRAANAKNPGASSSPVEKSKPSSTSAISQLADLSLPPFEVSSLRGEGVNRNFSAGMKAYASGDCAAAVRELARVPAGSADALTAQLYSGVCQMKLNWPQQPQFLTASSGKAIRRSRRRHCITGPRSHFFAATPLVRATIWRWWYPSMGILKSAQGRN